MGNQWSSDETGLYSLPARYYDPQTGRFLNSDSIEYLDFDNVNGLNLYSYCGGNPVMNVDPTGHFFITSILIALGVAALAGAAVGALGTLVGDVANFAFTGEWKSSSWEEYLGAAIGGAVGGMLSLIPGFGFGAAVIGGTLGTFTGLAIGKATGSNTMSWEEIGIQTAISFGVNLLTAGITKNIKIPGINSGRGSWAHVWKTGIGNALRHGWSISLKTIAKGFVSTIVSNLGLSFLLGSMIQGFINAQFILAEKEKEKERRRRRYYSWIS